MSGTLNLTQSLVQKLGSIVRGELPAGKPLPIEAGPGKKFGASRTVMREAVKILSTKGLIGQRPRVGT
jgi:DNA-binding FadR family transcriptional regulator